MREEADVWKLQGEVPINKKQGARGRNMNREEEREVETERKK